MPEASTTPKLPNMPGKNRQRTSNAGWYQNELLPWIQNQDLKTLVGTVLLGLLIGLIWLFIIIIDIILFLIICIEEFISNLSNLNLGSMQFEPESGDNQNQE